MDKNPSYILVNDHKKMFTNLNRFDKRKNRFEGEYSILHNQHSNDSYFLSRFLLNSKEDGIVLLNTGSERFREISDQYQRFEETDIHNYMDEKIQKNNELEKDILMDKNLGQLQLSIVKGMVEKQLESVKNQSAKENNDHKVLLGKELALEWTLHMINDIVEKGIK